MKATRLMLAFLFLIAPGAVLGQGLPKAFGDATRDLVYVPLTPCRLIDTRGFGAPFQGGAFAPNERRQYAPAGNCAVPVAGVASLMLAFTTQNLTPNSGGYLAIVAPGAVVNATVDIFNIGSEWSASNTVVRTGLAGQFDIFVSTANPHVVIDVLGYFAAPPGVTGSFFATPHNCQRTGTNATPLADTVVSHAPENFLSPSIATTDTTFTNVVYNCPIALAVPAGANLTLTGASGHTYDNSSNCRVQVDLYRRPLPGTVSSWTLISTMYNGASGSDFAFIEPEVAMSLKAFPAFSPVAITSTTILWAQVTFGRANPAVGGNCRYGGVVVNYSLDRP